MTEPVLLPVSYFPPVSYFYLLLHTGKALLEAEETYPKQTLRNRCSIYTANGVLDLSVPVSKPHGNKTKTKNVRISYRQNWQSNHWGAIKTAYSRSPFFLFFSDDIESLLFRKYDTLAEMNMTILSRLLHLVKINTAISFTEKFQKPGTIPSDYRYSSLLGSPANETHFMKYPQVFEEKFGFKADLSFLDLLFNTGPAVIDYLRSIKSEWLITPGIQS